jgi:hypothetical protein
MWENASDGVGSSTKVSFLLLPPCDVISRVELFEESYLVALQLEESLFVVL